GAAARGRGARHGGGSAEAPHRGRAAPERVAGELGAATVAHVVVGAPAARCGPRRGAGGAVWSPAGVVHGEAWGVERGGRPTAEGRAFRAPLAQALPRGAPARRASGARPRAVARLPGPPWAPSGGFPLTKGPARLISAPTFQRSSVGRAGGC